MAKISKSDSHDAFEMQEANELSIGSESRKDSDTAALEQAGKIPVLKVCF